MTRTKPCTHRNRESEASLEKVCNQSCYSGYLDQLAGSLLLSAAVRRHEHLASEHEAVVSQGQQLKAQNARLAEQVLALTSQLNTEKIKCEQQLRAARSHAQRLSDVHNHRDYLEQQVCELSLLPFEVHYLFQFRVTF